MSSRKSDSRDSDMMHNRYTYEKFDEFRASSLDSVSNFIEFAQRCMFMLEEINDYLTEAEKSVARDKINTIQEFLNEAGDLSKRLSKTEIEIGVIGREKAGKSTMLNAWLEANLLPTEKTRCTYTTAEIRSCENEADQKLIIEYLTKEEFTNHKTSVENELNKITNTTNNNYYNLLKSELEDITKIESEANRYLDKGRVTKLYSDAKNMDAIIIEAKAAIQNPGQARAVKSVTLYTTQLFKRKNITLFDVPGYDSPITFHKEQTKKKVLTVDAVIFAKNFNSPSLTDVEEEMIQIVSDDKYVSIKEKTIVALTHCDGATSTKDFNDTLKSAQKAWENYVTKERIVPICPAMKTLSDSEEKKELQHRIGNLKLSESFNTDGNIDILRNTVEKYIINNNYSYLVQRFKTLKSSFHKIMDDTIEIGRKKFPLEEEEEDLKKRLEQDKEKILFAWWSQAFKTIVENLEAYLQKEINGKETPDDFAKENSFILKFRKEYGILVEEMQPKNLPIMSKTRQLQIYKGEGYNHELLSASEGHTAIRKELAEKFYDHLIKFSDKLADIISEAIQHILDWIDKEMWMVKEIRETLYDDSYKNYLNTSIEALILRLARPAIDLFLRYPRYDNRENAIRCFMGELITLDIFYTENYTVKPRGLAYYLACGEWEGDINYEGLRLDIDHLKFSARTNSFEEAHAEISKDIDVFIDYMKNSIFYASGIKAFFQQELNKIIHKFKNEEKNKGTWQFYIMKSIKNGNDLIPVPNMVQEIEKRLFLSKETKDLNERLIHEPK